MAQHDYVIDNATNPTVRADINNALQAILTNNSGATAPSTTAANMMWYDTANAILKIRNAANSAWINVGTVDQTNGLFVPASSVITSAKTAAYTVVIADRNSTILCDPTSASFTVNLPAAATAGNGFMITFKKTDSGTNTVTVDANASETIDGNLTSILKIKDDTITIICNGTSWQTIGGVNGQIYARGADTASAATVSLDAIAGDFIFITGTTQITSFGTVSGSRAITKTIVFSGALTITHSSNLVCPYGLPLYINAADIITVRWEGGTVWRITDVQRQNNVKLRDVLRGAAWFGSDFCEAQSKWPLTTAVTGAGATVSQDSLVQGYAPLATGTTTTGVAQIVGGSTSLFNFNATNGPTANMIIAGSPIILPTAGEAFNFFAGFIAGSATSNTPLNTASFGLFHNHTYTNWQLKKRVSGVDTYVDTGVAASTNYNAFEIRVVPNTTAANTVVQLYYNGVLVATTTGIQGSITYDIMCQMAKTAGTTSRIYYLDMMFYEVVNLGKALS